MLSDSNDSKNKSAADGTESGNETGQNGDLVQGTLEMLILKTLQLEPMHGYGVALRIEQISNGVFRLRKP